jgi:flavodoxin
MNIAVRYLSKTGHTEKVAQAIAGTLGVPAVPINDPNAAAINGKLDVLFLGSAVYTFGIDEPVKSFIRNLDSGKVKKVVVFSTTALVKSAGPFIKKLLAEKGIPLAEQEFYCWGKLACLHTGHPNAADLEHAKAFAQEVITQLEKNR